MANRKKKVPIENIETKKATIQKENPANYDAMQPAWRFNKAPGTERRWSIFRENHRHFVEVIIPKLSAYEKMTWAEIKGPSHNVSCDKCIKDAQKELQDLHIYYDEIFSLRLTGEKRIWGILEKGVLNILWYDEKHEICPSHKKHT